MSLKENRNFLRLSLTQQVLLLILMTLAFATCFFFFFLNDNINTIISKRVFSLMSVAQAPIARALEDGKSIPFDRELFFYLTAGSEEHIGLVTDDGNITFSHSGEEQDERMKDFEHHLILLAKDMIEEPSVSLLEEKEDYKGMEIYFRLERIQYGEGSAVLFTYMDSTYSDEMRSALIDSTIYVTMLAFVLILMIFIFWVFSIIHPLNQVKAYITQLKEGNDVDLYVDRNDEIGEVANELRMLTAELAKQEKAKEDMIHNISHDLKTPIATIKSYSESIKDGIYPYGDLVSSVDVIYNNAQRLEDKVNSLLYMNRVEYLISSGGEGVMTNMKEVVDEVVLNAAVIRPEIRIETDVEEAYFNGITEAWRVCIENIIENAFRYANSYIKIVVRPNDLRIYNDGPKMPEDRIASLFSPFMMGEGGKFGLGLSIVAKVCNATNYKVEGLNTEDGVCFRIWRDEPAKKVSKFKTTGFSRNTYKLKKEKGNPKKEGDDK